MKHLTSALITCLFLICCGSDISAQCTTVTLTTQQDVDSYFISQVCPVFTGNLIIDDDGTDPITSLAVISNASMTSVTGSFNITNCTSLTSLDGLQGLVSIGQALNIRDATALTDLSALDNLQTVGAFLQVRASAAQDLSFASVTSIGGDLVIRDNDNLLDVSGFNSLTTVFDLRFFTQPICQDVSGFQSLTTVNGDLRIVNHFTMPGVTGFGAVTSVGASIVVASTPMSDGFPLFGPSYPVGVTLQLSSCNAIDDISNFSAVTSIGGNLLVFQNAVLSDCCIIPDLDVFGTITINNNDPGCNSLAEINAGVPVVVCPADQTVSYAEGPSFGCIGEVTIIHPIPTDDCEVTLTELVITDPDGNINFTSFNPGSSTGYELDFLGEYTFTFSASDDLEQTGECSMTVTVVDDIAPIWDDPSGSMTITGICGVDDPAVLANANIPTASDGNCGGTVTVTSQVSTSPMCGGSETVTYTYTAMDDTGNVNPDNIVITIILVDNSPPTIAGVGSDEVISCDDSFPNIPSPTASDVCTGDLTSMIVETVTITPGDCTVSVPAEVHLYTWTVEDGCGNTATASWTVTVNNDFTADLGDDIQDCQPNTTTLGPIAGATTYMWSTGETTSTIDVFDSGTYAVTATSGNGCCATDEVIVTFDQVPDAIADGGVLDCTGNGVMLLGESNLTNVTYSWAGPGGFTSNDQNPTVFESGTYTLFVTGPTGCQGSTDADVIQDIDVPDLNVFGGTLDCSNTSVQLISNTSTTGASYDWTGPNGFTSTEADPIVSTAGVYTLIITATNGCTATAGAEVLDDTMDPTATAMVDMLTCAQTSTQIITETSVNAAFFSWVGPNGFTSTDSDPFVSEEGTYTLTVEAVNGCTSMIAVVVEGDFEVPDVIAEGGVIDCAMSSVTLMGSSSTTGATFAWSGPGGFASMEASPVVMMGGSYTLTVTGTNGCTITANATVEEDATVPSATVEVGVLSCSQLSTQIMTTGSADATSYSWTGPNGFMSMDEDPVASEVGVYTLTVGAANGCTSVITVEVIGDFIQPNASATGATLDCTSTAIIIAGNSTTGNVTYSWSGPGGFTSTEQNPSVTSIGIYTLTVTAPNGCTGTSTAMVDADEDVPMIAASGGTIDCNVTSVELMGSSATTGVALSWTGPGGFTTTDANPTVTVAGIYTLTVQADNGCVATQDAEVVDDTSAPEVMLSLGDADCENGTRQIVATTNTEDLAVSWTGPGGFTFNELSPMVSLSGTYVMETFPTNGCNSSHMIILADDVAYTADITTEGITNTMTSGSATINITDGTGPFTVMWDNGETGTTALDLSEGEHTVTVRDGLGCIQVFNFVIQNTTSTVDQDLLKMVSMFPNPASDILTIELQDNHNIVSSIEIYGTDGQLLKSILVDGAAQNLSVSVSDWTKGVYLAKVNTTTSFQVFRFMVN